MNQLHLCSLIIVSQLAFAQPLTKVRIDFAESLGTRETTSSARFQQDYEQAIALGKSITKEKLAKCGYELEAKTSFYDANDALKAKEAAISANAQGSWMIVGPRRSNHYLLLTQGAGSTPSVSLMASADEVSKLQPHHVSLSPSNSEIARIAANEAASHAGSRASYFSVISDDCTACVDFGKSFDRFASQSKLKKTGEALVRGEEFDPKPIHDQIIKANPAIVLLPNYSKVSLKIMQTFSGSNRSPLFIGSDGWGDPKYGFVQSADTLKGIKGITLRGFPPVESGLKTFSVGRTSLLKSKEGAPELGPGMGILRIIGETADALCLKKPKTRQDFTAQFETSIFKRLQAPWGISVYELNADKMNFRKTVSIR